MIAWGFTIKFSLDPTLFLPLAVLISVMAQVGDLHESLTKRIYDVKDSSQILPGHGGILDRIDGIIFAIPGAFILDKYIF